MIVNDIQFRMFGMRLVTTNIHYQRQI